MANTFISDVPVTLLNAVTAVACDGASNMKKAFQNFTHIDRLWCLAHCLHLIVTNALGFWLKIPITGVDDNTENSFDYILPHPRQRGSEI